MLNPASQKLVERVVLEKSFTLMTPPKLAFLGIFVIMHYCAKTTPSASFRTLQNEICIFLVREGTGTF